MHELSLRTFCLAILAASILVAQDGPNAAQAPAPQTQTTPTLAAGLYAYIDTSMGEIVCRLEPSQAPNTVANFRALATRAKAWTDPRDGKQKHLPFYSGLTFHRVIKGFMVQGGDPLGTGEGGPGFSID